MESRFLVPAGETYYQTVVKDGKIYIESIAVDGRISSREVRDINVLDVSRISDERNIYKIRGDNIIKSILYSEAKRFTKNPLSDKELSRIDFNFLADYSGKIMDPRYTELLTKIIDTITSVSHATDHTLEEKIRLWLKHVTVIGSGNFGVAAKTGINRINNLIVFKYNLRRETDITHEFVVGKLLNTLRDEEKTINFVYTYEAFKCGESPVIDSELPAFCHHGEKYAVDHIVLENITNAKDMADLLGTPDLSTFNYLSIFFQLFFSLGISNIELGFTHWDLHGHNVLIKSVRELSETWARYTLGSATDPLYIKTFGNIPYIIDLGQSSIRTSTGAYLSPVSDSSKSLLYRGEPFFLFDIYKLIVVTLGSYYSIPTRNQNKEIIEFCRRSIQSLFGLERSKSQSILNAIEKGDNTQWQYALFYRLPSRGSLDNDVEQALKIVLEILDGMKIDYSQFISYDRPRGEDSVLSCDESTWCSSSVKEKGPQDFDNYLDLCYSQKKLSVISGTARAKVATSIAQDTTNLRGLIEQKGKDSLEIMRTVLSPLETIKSGRQLPELQEFLSKNSHIYSYTKTSGPDAFYVLLVKLYSQLVEVWSAIEHLSDIYDMAKCIGYGVVYKKENDALRTYLLNSYNILKEEVVPAARHLKERVENLLVSAEPGYNRWLMSNPQRRLFLLNWGLFQYIIELDIRVPSPLKPK